MLWFGYVLIRHIKDPAYRSILGPLNLGLHEFGHLIFIPLGQFMHMAGGTIFQIFVPIFAVFNFYSQDDYFALALSFGWLSTSFFDVATYIADARAMNMLLVSPFAGVTIHDWNYLLQRFGLLQYDAVIAFGVRIFAVVSMVICLTFGIWLLICMMRYGKAKTIV